MAIFPDFSSLQNTLQGQEQQGQMDAEIQVLQERAESLLTQQGSAPQQAVPPVPGRLARCGAQFAANLGASLLQNPQVAQNTARQIEGILRRAQNVEDRNFLQDAVADKSQRNSLLAFRLKAISNQVERLQEAGDLEGANRAAAEQLKLIKQIELEFAQEKSKTVTLPEIKARGAGKLAVVKANRPGGIVGGPAAQNVEEITAESFVVRRDSLNKQFEKLAISDTEGARTLVAQLIDLALVPQKGDTRETARRRITQIAFGLPGINTLAQAISDPVVGPEVQRAMRTVSERF